MVEEAAVLIDNGYFKEVIKEIFNNKLPKIDYLKLSEEICRKIDKKRYRTYLYDSLPWKGPNPTKDESERYSRAQKFFTSLSSLPSFEVRLGKLVRRNNEFIQKGVDILLVIDIVKLTLKDRVRHIAIITGDADYVPAFKLARDEGVKIYLFHSPNKKQYSDELYLNSDERYPINMEFLKNLIIEE